VRGRAAALALAALVLGLTASDADAHAWLVSSDPAANAALGDTPSAISLSFSERPDPSLSSVTVVDHKGVAYQLGPPSPARGDPLSLIVPLRPLPVGVYTVHWRVDAALDGHVTTGIYGFGVRVLPTAASSVATSVTRPVSTVLELIARAMLLIGLVVLVGAATAGAAGFGGPERRNLSLAAGGWLLSLAGLVALVEAERRNAQVSLGTLLDASVGRALIWRAASLAVAGVALLIAVRWASARRAALAAAALAAVGTIVVHVANGHAAAAGSWPSGLTVSAQAIHFAVAAVWAGGLAALIAGIGVRSRPSAHDLVAIRRFSTIAAAGLLVVVATGIVRAFSELRTWGELFSTGYGRAVLAKLALAGIIAVLAARNRLRSVPAAAGDVRPLRRTSAGELSFAAAALVVAALLGTLAPPGSGTSTGLQGLFATGADAGHTVRVRVSTVSDEPGPNRFTVAVDDFGSGAPIRDAGVSLGFTPLDDPGVPPSALRLSEGRSGAYVGSGANLTFDGRWGVTVQVTRGGHVIDVPLELDPIGAPQQISIERIPGQYPKFTKLVGDLGIVRISPHPDRSGQSAVFVNFYTVALGDPDPIASVVVTAATAHGPARQVPVRRLDASTFVSAVHLAPGHDQIAVVAHTVSRLRLRSVFDLYPAGG
jgi:copper transport protein